jgi:hypothetical protein
MVTDNSEHLTLEQRNAIRMKERNMPRGTDSELLIALGAKPLAKEKGCKDASFEG